MSNENFIERRRADRARRILSIQYRLLKSPVQGGDTQWHLSTTYDMSVLGISFLSDVPYHIDDILELQVIMSGVLDIFKGFGKVVRVEKKASGSVYLLALKFVSENAQTKDVKSYSRPATKKSPRAPKRK